VTVTAAAAGSWRLGDLTVNRLGFGAMRLTGGAVSPPVIPVVRADQAAGHGPSPPGRRAIIELVKN
jgi:pyridoxine 4-dehydrogenase